MSGVGPCRLRLLPPVPLLPQLQTGPCCLQALPLCLLLLLCVPNLPACSPCSPSISPRRDGYAIAILFRAAATLSLDFLAASDAAVLRMGEAAQQMCEQLVQQWPGTRVAASSLARLPRA